MKNMDWYHSLKKPKLSPPDEIFAPVWTVLYLMIAASLVVFLQSVDLKANFWPFMLFLLQLALNFSWSGVFFGMKKIAFALQIIIVMWVVLLLTIITFYMYSKTAAWLLVPYFVWISFAIYLNFEIWRLNCRGK